MFENSNGNGMFMPVAPAGYGYGNNGGFFGGDGGWLAILFLFALMSGGWGGMGGFGGGMGLYPWMNQADITTSGFQNQMLNTGVMGVQNAVTTGFGDTSLGIAGINQNICQTGNGITQALSSGFAQAEIGENARQMANMQQMYGIQSSLQQCCCDNRAATADLKYTIATEAAANRAAGQANTQAVLDKLCQLELDGVKQNYENRIAGLQNALDVSRSDNQALRFAASQGAQTAAILANNDAQTNALEQYLAPIPRPAYVVQNPNCCNNGFGGNNWAA